MPTAHQFCDLQLLSNSAPCLAGISRHIRTELLVAAEYTQKAVQSLLDGELDLGIFVLPSSTEGLAIEKLCQDELVVIVAPTHPWAQRRRVQWTDLATQALTYL